MPHVLILVYHHYMYLIPYGMVALLDIDMYSSGLLKILWNVVDGQQVHRLVDISSQVLQCL
jgi:hypothetical protein